MRVQLVDPSAFTPPYDRSLAAALARRRVDVELLTSRFLYGTVPEPDGYRVRESFYRRASSRGLEAPGRRGFKLAEHLPGMLRLRREVDADVVHYQWLTVPALDPLLLPPARPRVMTAHHILPAAPSRRQVAVARRMFERMDAVIAHSQNGAGRLVTEVGLSPARVRVIPHGAFDYLTRLPREAPLPAELEGAEGPVILFFGLLRPYKGLDTLLEAFRRVEAAELWVVGNARIDTAPLRDAAAAAGGRVRLVTRFVGEDEIPAIFSRADVVALPYREAEHSGVLYTALAFAKPLVLTAVGGFAELAERHRAAVVVPPDDPGALAGALNDLVADERRRVELASAARSAAEGEYSWDAVAARTVSLYEELLEARR